MSRPRIRGNWHHGVKGYFVDVRALDTFLKILPWMLAFDAIIRGWEYMRISGFLLVDIPTRLVPLNGESLVQYEFFGFSIMLAGLLMILGIALGRFFVIISATLMGAASYLLLSGNFIVDAFFSGGETTIGLRGAFAMLVLAFLWIFKGFFTATKKSISDVEKEAKKSEEGIING